MKIRLVGVELFYVDGWTDGRTDRHDEAKQCFSKFCKSAQNVKIAKWTQNFLRMQGTCYSKLEHE